MLLSVLVLLGSTCLMPCGVVDETLKNWPQWRGPTWNGVAPHADPPATWSETENLRWKVAIEGRGKGTPILWGERLFLLTAIPLDEEHEHLVLRTDVVQSALTAG